MIKDYSQYINNDLHKIYLFTHSDRSSFSHIDSLVRSVADEIFLLLMPPGIFTGSLIKELPILNYGNTTELQHLIDGGFVKKENIYNLPENLKNANSKVEFHKKTKGLSFIPNTVFTKEDAMELKFPIIAKPAEGSKGEGIEVFNTKEDLKKNKNKDKFDVFSEKFNLKREFRIISINGEVIFIAERIPNNDKANSLRESNKNDEDIFDRTGTLMQRSSYKWKVVKPGKGGVPDEIKIKSLCKSINKALGLEFLGIDLGLADDDKLYVIEANTCPGLNKDQIVLIYESLFKDFYKKEVDEYTNKKLTFYKNELIRANNDPAKFSFAPYQGNLFYYYDDKIDMGNGEKLGKSILTAKYDIEKSWANSLLNIKKEYTKNESNIMDFNTFLLNESEIITDVMQNYVNDLINKLLTSKIKPTEVFPHGKDKTELKLSVPDNEDGETVNEEVQIHFDKDKSLLIKFNWTYTYKEGIKSSNYDQPDDAGEYILDSIKIEEAEYFYDDKNVLIDLNPEISMLLQKYLIQFILVDGYSRYLKK